MMRVIILAGLLFFMTAAILAADLDNPKGKEDSGSAQSTLPLQERCSKAAHDVFVEKYESVNHDTKELGHCNWSYESHYNKKLDRCFICASGRCFNNDESSEHAELVDIFANKIYASYEGTYSKDGILKDRSCALDDNQFNMFNGLEFNKETKKWDIVSKGYLHSLEEPFSDPVRKEFDDWIKPYMEE
jgi:hypothetical protein